MFTHGRRQLHARRRVRPIPVKLVYGQISSTLQMLNVIKLTCKHGQFLRAAQTAYVAWRHWKSVRFLLPSIYPARIIMVADRAERVAQSTNPFYRLLPALFVPDGASTASEFVSAHCAGVTWYLTRRLTYVSQMQRDMQEERVRRETERTRTLGSGVARELLSLSANTSEHAHPESSGWFGSASSALGASWTVAQHPSLEDLDPIISDEDEDDVELSASQIQQFEAENAQILRSAEDSLAAVRQAEARLLEISALQAELVAQLTRQTELTDQLYEDAIATSEMVEKGNVQLREARRRARDGRKWLLLFLIGASLSLLFLHYY
jgi:syntaxin 18